MRWTGRVMPETLLFRSYQPAGHCKQACLRTCGSAAAPLDDLLILPRGSFGDKTRGVGPYDSLTSERFGAMVNL